MTRRASRDIVAPIVLLQHKVGEGIVDTLRGQAVRLGPNWRLNISSRAAKPQTTCWCERRIVDSTWQRIYDGAGESCGRPDCKPKETT